MWKWLCSVEASVVIKDKASGEYNILSTIVKASTEDVAVQHQLLFGPEHLALKDTSHGVYPQFAAIHYCWAGPYHNHIAGFITNLFVFIVHGDVTNSKLDDALPKYTVFISIQRDQTLLSYVQSTYYLLFRGIILKRNVISNCLNLLLSWKR